MNRLDDNKLYALEEISQAKLINILEKIPGQKDFIIESKLIKPLDCIIGVKKLRENGVNKIYILDKNPFPNNNTQRVFFISPDLIMLKNVCDKINAELSSRPVTNNYFKNYHVIFLGRHLSSLLSLLEEEGLYGEVSTYSFRWELIKVDDRILSLEYHNLYKMLFVEGDQSLLPCIAKSIWTLQLLFGQPYLSITQGKYSQQIEKMVSLLHKEVNTYDEDDTRRPCFVLIDRDIDYASALLTGTTYTSLLDEVFGIKTGYVEVKSENKDKPSSRNLNNADPIYSDIKSLHFSAVIPFLRAKTKELTADFAKKQDMALAEMKRFVSKELQSITFRKQSLAYHIEASEAIMCQLGQQFGSLKTTEENILEGRNRRESLSFIEESLVTEPGNKYRILRLVSLMSLCQDGLYPDEAHNLKMQFLHAHGYQNLPCFHKLNRLGLFNETSIIPPDVKGGAFANKVVQAVPLPTRRSMFLATAQKFKLIPPSAEINPSDMSYVFNGSYTPLVCQIIYLLIKNEITPEDIPKMIGNCTVQRAGKELPKSFIVFFIGGVTYAEIAAFQLLESLTGIQVIVAATSIINGNLMMQACL